MRKAVPAEQAPAPDGTSFDRQAELRCLSDLTLGKDAWRRFIAIFGPFLYSEFSRHGIQPGPLRDDLLQELTLVLMSHDWRPLRRHLDSGFTYSFNTVLRRIVRSVVVDNWRRSRRWTQLSSLEDTAEPVAQDALGCGSDPQELLAARGWVTDLLGAAGLMEDSVRQTLYLRFWEDQSVKFIAECLRTSPNAISQRLRYYVNKLRRSAARGSGDAK